ncbi:MAG: hypothetical protein JWM89_1797 [Acidimicrobiales bacterium]|nr:hypothetical protein [Acidimicrobiales bacterium]
MTLEDELDPLTGDLNWSLGGLRLGEGAYRVVTDEGLEGFEIETEDGDTAGDGAEPGYQRLAPRAVTLTLNVVPPAASDAVRKAAMSVAMHDLALVINPLEDRINARRMLRWTRAGEPAKRLYYRPANGQALAIAGTQRRLQYHDADIVVRLECADPIIVSDEYEDFEFAAGETIPITNAGTLTAVLPTAWELTGDTTVRLQHLDHPREDITFPSWADLTVSRTLEIVALGTYNIAHGPGNNPFPLWPVLRPGVNNIKASAACTLRKWDTFT